MLKEILKMKIGIIGQGFVGSAIRNGLEGFYDCYAYDKNPDRSRHTFEDVVENSSIIFVCVPTPMRKSGECDIRILEEAISSLDRESKKKNKSPILVIKSTIPPGTTEKIGSKTFLDVCFSPEFLTEANSYEDFKNQTRIIIGGPRPATGVVKSMFRKPFPEIPIIKTGSKTAEMVKYFTNCFLATKVTFANQMYELCESMEIDYDKVCEYSLYDKRIGRTHMAVPGPDGDRGFGGHCFPKDLAAAIFFGKENEVNTEFLIQVEESNKNYRSNSDWLSMTGRAVSED